MTSQPPAVPVLTVQDALDAEITEITKIGGGVDVDQSVGHSQDGELADNRTRKQLIFDKATHAYLGERWTDAKTGELQWITAQLSRAVVDHAGQTPN
jgi:hypothetical protein